MQLTENEAAGALAGYDMLEVLKLGSSDTLARSRIFLGCRMTEVGGGPRVPKGGRVDNLDARNAIVGACGCYLRHYSNLL